MGTQKKILIVEDERDMVELMAIRLRAADYDVVAAYDGQEGWAAVKKHKPDLIILDIMMPKLDGYHVCRLVKTDPAYNHIPVVILTAKSQDRDRINAKTVEADAFVTKPFDGRQLLDTIAELLNR